MSKGIYRTEVKIFKNDNLISSEWWFDNGISSDYHYGKVPEPHSTKSILAEKLFGLDVDVYDMASVNGYHDYKHDLMDRLGLWFSYDMKIGFFGKAKYYAKFSNQTVKFKHYDVFRFERHVYVTDNWTLDKVISDLPINECKEFLIDNGFISKNPSPEELTRVCGYIGR